MAKTILLTVALLLTLAVNAQTERDRMLEQGASTTVPQHLLCQGSDGTAYRFLSPPDFTPAGDFIEIKDWPKGRNGLAKTWDLYLSSADRDEYFYNSVEPVGPGLYLSGSKSIRFLGDFEQAKILRRGNIESNQRRVELSCRRLAVPNPELYLPEAPAPRRGGTQ